MRSAVGGMPTLLALALVILVVVGYAAAHPQGNLAPNPSFEEGTAFPQGWRAEEWPDVSITWDSEVVHSGKRAMKWTFPVSPSYYGCAIPMNVLASDPIDVDEDATYQLTVWARSASIDGWSAALHVNFRVLDSAGGLIGAIGDLPVYPGSQWKSASITVGPGGERSWLKGTAKVSILLINGAEGQWGANCPSQSLSLWADDVSFSLAAPRPAATPTLTPRPWPTPTPPPHGQIINCPLPGKWALAYYNGPGASLDDVQAACPFPIDVAFRIDRDWQLWRRYFRQRPEISNLGRLWNGEGLLVLGSSSLRAASHDQTTPQPLGQMYDCPRPDMWAISVWLGDPAAAIEEALATCLTGVAAAYWIDPYSQIWSRYFAGRPDISDLKTAAGGAFLTLGTRP